MALPAPLAPGFFHPPADLHYPDTFAIMMPMKTLLLYPFNGITREAVGVIEAINRETPTWEILGFVDDDPARAGDSMANLKVLGPRSVFEEYPNAHVLAIPGRPDNYWNRLDVLAELGIAPDRFVSLVHPRATLGPGCTLAENTLLMAGVVLTADVRVEAHVAILPNSVLGYDVRVGSGTLIGAGVVIAGGVQLGECCYVGSGSNILQEVIIGEAALIGLGSTILHSVPPRTVVAGNPGKLLRAIPADS